MILDLAKCFVEIIRAIEIRDQNKNSLASAFYVVIV